MMVSFTEDDTESLRLDVEGSKLCPDTLENVDNNTSNFFRPLYDTDTLKIFTVSGFLIGFGLALPSLAGIIWYEKYGNHRYR